MTLKLLKNNEQIVSERKSNSMNSLSVCLSVNALYDSFIAVNKTKQSLLQNFKKYAVKM